MRDTLDLTNDLAAQGYEMMSRGQMDMATYQLVFAAICVIEAAIAPDAWAPTELSEVVDSLMLNIIDYWSVHNANS